MVVLPWQPATATTLRAVRLGQRALGITAGSDGHDNIADWNQILVATKIICGRQFGPTLIAILVDELL